MSEKYGYLDHAIWEVELQDGNPLELADWLEEQAQAIREMVAEDPEVWGDDE